MTAEEREGMEYIAAFSGRKDSTATIILAHEHGEPLNTIVFSEVMFDTNISGELPEHIAFIKEKCKPLFQSWGYKVEILRAEKTYMDCFNHIVEKPRKNIQNAGKKAGFPMAGKCSINRDCKVKPITEYFKGKDLTRITQYIGIAADETKRLERLKTGSPIKISLLEKYGYTEKMAMELCEKYGLVSPIYDFAPRGGRWFCPNAREAELRHLRINHKELWERLRQLEREPNIIGNLWNTLTQKSIEEWEEYFFWSDAQMTIFDFKEVIPDTERSGNGGEEIQKTVL